ncbi:MAG: flagellar brake protein [Armatimonadetes bacterium]|nr:flagellar brake protein [Armatimonadota bacterium]
MFWRKKTEDRVNIFSLVRVNDRIQLKVYGRAYLSRVEDIRGQELFVGAPVEQNRVRMLPTGREVTVSLFAVHGLQQFSAVVVRMETNRIPLVVLSNFKAIGTVQRREYVRVLQKLPIRYRPLSGPKGGGPWFNGITNDLSGGGVQLTVRHCGLEVGDLLEIELFLPGEEPISAVGQVVRSTQGYFSILSGQTIGIKFTEIDSAERDRIVRYVFKKQSEMLDSRRSFVRVRQRVEVSYRRSNKHSFERGYTLDMSTGGLRLVALSGESFNTGDILDIWIVLSNSTIIGATGEVVWVGNGKETSAQEQQIGIKFTKIDSESRALLADFLSGARTEDNQLDDKAA